VLFFKNKVIASVCVTFKHVKVKEPPHPHPSIARKDKFMIMREVNVNVK
jgi:hypothetical protein